MRLAFLLGVVVDVFSLLEVDLLWNGPCGVEVGSSWCGTGTLMPGVWSVCVSVFMSARAAAAAEAA